MAPLIKQIKTKWGSCNTDKKSILLNLELAKKPLICLEYIIVHELVHLLERHHNERFLALMNRYMPQWKFHWEELNRLPVSHGEWGY
ncbi:M48 family metallopeptidase [Chitinophaga sp. CC14]|uniref:YgjP-like metallopeptidase domain-containing protein n=1 Tax=Chitinophaga sp. CC14 TaxID=3029199 RepID=UPI003B7F26E3